jgi:hypothetical protein
VVTESRAINYVNLPGSAWSDPTRRNAGATCMRYLAGAYVVVAGFRSMTQPKMPIAIRHLVGRYTLICFTAMMVAAILALTSSRVSPRRRGILPNNTRPICLPLHQVVQIPSVTDQLPARYGAEAPELRSRGTSTLSLKF